MVPYKIEVLILFTILHFGRLKYVQIQEETMAMEFMTVLQSKLTKNYQELAKFRWWYHSNVTNKNHQSMVQAEKDFYTNLSDFQQEALTYDYQNFRNETLKGLFRKLVLQEVASSSGNVTQNLIDLQVKMKKIYASTKICSCMNQMQCNISISTNLNEIFAKRTSHTELLYSWLQFHDSLSARLGPIYGRYVQISNQVSEREGFRNTFEKWLRPYYQQGGNDFMAELQSKILTKLQPFYLQLHAYVRFKLRQTYGSDIVLINDSIPAHLLGHPSALNWNEIYNILMPYPTFNTVNFKSFFANRSGPDIYKDAEAFFLSLNMSRMSKTFWIKSIFKQTRNRNILCEPLTENFFKSDEVAILQCTQNTFRDFLIAHRQMAQAQYYLQYQSQPILFQSPPNLGFEEALGDSISLSVRSRKHMKTIGILKFHEKSSRESQINDMLKIALERVVPIFVWATADLWRQGVFNGTIKAENFNSIWWKYRIQFEGIKPPIARGNEDFDAASVQNIISGIPFLRYIVGNLLQFQIHRGLCIKAEEYVPQYAEKLPLHNCDIYGSKEAGQALKDALGLGSSQSVTVVLEMLSGEKHVNPDALLEYFQPLHDWLISHNHQYQVPIGWEQLADQNTAIKDPLYDEAYADVYLEMVTARIREYSRLTALEQWERAVNGSISPDNSDVEKLQNELVDLRTYAQKFFYYNFRTESLKDQYVKFTQHGPLHINRGVIENLELSIAILKTTYGSTEIQSYTNKMNPRNLSVFVNLNQVYGSAQNPAELMYLWKEFRNEVGPKIKVPFQHYVHISNLVARTKGYRNTMHQWTQEQGISIANMANIIDEIQIFYRELHAFVRFHLKHLIQDYNLLEDGSIQSYLLDTNVSSMRWNRILGKLIETSYRAISKFSVGELYQGAQNFFESLGFGKMPDHFWQHSIFNSTTPNCKSFIWYSFNGDNDVRNFKCKASIDLDLLLEVYQDVGDSIGVLTTQNSSIILQNSPNLGIRKAIRNSIGLAVNNRFYLWQQFLKVSDANNQTQKLLKVALETVPVLMNIYVLEKWRSEVFQDEIPVTRMNQRWWELQQEYLGVNPMFPLENFDPGATYEIISGTEMISTFIGIVLGFQIHSTLCEETLQDLAPFRNFDDHDCNIYNSKEAGRFLRESMETVLTNTTNEYLDTFEYTRGLGRLNAKALLKYFAPLRSMLRQFITEKNITLGWNLRPEFMKKVSDQGTGNTNENLSAFGKFTKGLKNFLRTALAIFNLFFWR